MILKNKELGNKILIKIHELERVHELEKIKTIDCLVIGTKGDTIIKDCTKLILNNQRYDYINDTLVKVK